MSVVLYILIASLLGGVLPGLVFLGSSASFLAKDSPESIILCSVLVALPIVVAYLIGAFCDVTLVRSHRILAKSLSLVVMGLLGGTALGRTFMADSVTVAASRHDQVMFVGIVLTVASSALMVSCAIGVVSLLVPALTEFVGRSVIRGGGSASIPWVACRQLTWLLFLSFGWNIIAAYAMNECQPFTLARHALEMKTWAFW